MKKGYTLIELLAVIVILSIIAIITIPMMLNIIDNARRKAALDSAYGVLESAKIYHINHFITSGGTFEEVVFTCDGECVSEDNELGIEGSKPNNGTLKIEMDGTISGNLSFYNGDYTFYVCNNSIFEEELTSCSSKNMLTISDETYQNGDVVNYAGLLWYILKDNGSTSTLVLKNSIEELNHGEEPYNYSTSPIKTKLDVWFNNNPTLTKAKEEEKLFSMNFTSFETDYDEYIRIPTKEEATTITSFCASEVCDISFWSLTYDRLNEVSYIWSINNNEIASSMISSSLGIRPVITVMEQ